MNDNELAHSKSKYRGEVPLKKISEPEEKDTPNEPKEETTGTEKFTGLIDLSDKNLYDPNQDKYKRNNKETGTRAYSFVSIYMKKDEQEHLKKLAQEYNTTVAAIVRKLIINAK